MKIDINYLIKEAQKQFAQPRTIVPFETGIDEAERLLNDIEEHPHLFVLACVMDRQVTTGRAWLIPYKICKEIGSFKFEKLAALSEADCCLYFSNLKLHRFNTLMAKNFNSAVQLIQSKYNGDASKIWANKPKSAAVIRRFLEFNGVGVKIATMATNILIRDFKVEMQDLSSIDISPDVQVRKFLIQNNFIRANATNEEIIYWAREHHPEYPGIFDKAAWEWGRKYGNLVVSAVPA